MRPFRFLSDNLDETLFEHRNKEYGAYPLRKSYDARVIKSFLLTLTLIALSFGVPVLIQSFFKKPIDIKEDFSVRIVTFEEKPGPEQKKNTLIPLSGEIPKQLVKPDAPYLVKKDSLITKDETKKDTATTLNTSGSSISNDTTQGEIEGTITVKAISGDGTSASAEPLSLATVDKIPQFPGGESSMSSFLKRNISYNKTAREEQVTGKVYASFIVNSKGEVESIKIIRSLGFGLDEEVTRVLGLMPKWEPGYYRGKPVSTIMNLPVSFNLVQ
jgi:protein TonB